jgi:sterol 3beta-glucosyltransferase
VVNQCRSEILGLQPLPAGFYHRLDVSRIPLVYGFSPNLLPRPADWGDWLQVSGHWFLDEQTEWQPPDELVRFLDSGKPPVYIGFGSMIDEQIKQVTPVVLEALRATDQRGILLGGWGGLGNGDLPESVLHIESVPHDWLFPRVLAVVHHGGAGTTATGLRHGRPTVIVPFFADQPFWGEQVYRLGAGPHPIPFKRLNGENLTQAVERSVNDPNIKQKAGQLGEKIRREDGVGKAVSLIQAFVGNPD